MRYALIAPATDNRSDTWRNQTLATLADRESAIALVKLVKGGWVIDRLTHNTIAKG